MDENKKVDRETMRPQWKEIDINMDKNCTCNICGRREECSFAWDIYNINGDCLWLK